MKINAYFLRVQDTIDQYSVGNVVLSANMNFERRSGDQAYLSGSVAFIDGSILHFSEYLDQVGETVEKIMYRYHYQDPYNNLIFRYDNANHKPPLSSSEHKHLPDCVVEASAPNIDDVLAEIFSAKCWI